MDTLSNSAQYVKGVGPARFKVLNRLGIYTVEDLLYYFPRRYEDRSRFIPINQLETGSYATVKGEVLTLSLRRSKRGLSIFQTTVGDDSGVITAVWFNQPFMKRYFRIGQELILYGRVERYRQLQMNSPEYEFISAEDNSLHMGRIVPVYPLTAGINQRYLRTIINRAFQSYCSYIPDTLPYNLRKRLGLVSLTLALRNIHLPQDFSAQGLAYKRLVFDEFFLFQALLALKKSRQTKQKKGIAHKTEGKLVEAFQKSLPFKLTPSQNKVIKEIESDMRSPSPMNRLLQGDVGSGKTVVAADALVLSVQSGYQAAIMVPTEILAEQHYFMLSKLLLPLNINVGLLISSMNRQAKQQTLQDLQSGMLDAVIGTHALIEENIQFKKLGLVVVDEQHKFGVVQRSHLCKKGRTPDYLVMTATPIPRTLAMTVYGDLDISTIRELPKGRVPVSTIWVKEPGLKDVYKFVREEIGRGRQAYIVYPLVKKNAVSELKAATEMYKRFKEEEFRSFRLGLIHGQMPAEEKEKIMGGFKKHKIDILVSTSVVEVGVDIPNAVIMMIEGAENFGLAQLHQFRGRVGRGDHQSYCFLFSETENLDSIKRLEYFEKLEDGFKLAEKDLETRGPGEVYGTKQSGGVKLKLARLSDKGLIKKARQSAQEIVKDISKYPKIKIRISKSSENVHLE